MYKKIIKLANSVDDLRYKSYILSIAKKISNKDKIVVNINDLLKLVEPERVEYDSEDAIDAVSVVRSF